MPPPRGTPNILEGPGDYDVTSIIHNDTYPAIDPSKADFSGKAVFVSGGSRGLGRAMVLSFAKAGASYIAAGARSDMSQLAKDIAAAAASANRPPPTFMPLKLDVTDQKSVDAAAAAVQREFGRCDVVVNNAGVMGNMSLVAESDPEDWWRTLDINVRGSYLISRAFLPLLLRGGDKYLIHVSSVAAHLMNPTLSAYQASKAALLHLSRTIDAEYAPLGVTSFCIHPGNIPTDILAGIGSLPEHLKPVFVETPEISADTIIFLTSEKRQWIGGRYINVTWDMPELMAKEAEIVKGDKLKVRLVF